MSPEQKSPEPSDDEVRRRQLLQTIGEIIANEDYTFLIEIAAQQNLLRSFELAEYMNVMRKASEDPVESRRWENGLTQFLVSLSGQEFPQDEGEALKAITDEIEFESIMKNEALAQESSQSGSSERKEKSGDEPIDFVEVEDQDVENWEEDNFYLHGIGQDTIERIRKTPVFQKAEATATNPYNTSYNKLERAQEMIKDYSSNDRVEGWMRSALDKHVFNTAYAMLTSPYNTRYDKTQRCKEIIERRASTPERRDAMFRRLGFM